MTEDAFAKLVLDMLLQQQRYFKSRKTEDLIASKNLERQVKEAAQAILKKQEELRL